MRAWVKGLLFPGLFAVLSATACGTAATSTTPTAVGGGTANIRINGDWGNPVDGGATVSGTQGGVIAEGMYDRLIDYNYKTGAIVPYLASSWTVTSDSVTFKIRGGATCSDGTPVNASVVYNSFARFISPQTASRWAVTILGPGPYKIAKDDAAQTFTFTTPAPFNNLLPAFGWYWTGVVCPAGLQPGANFTKQSYGSGPYVFESATQGADYVMVKRKDWSWGPKGNSNPAGRPDRLDFKVVANETTAANLLLTGGLDIANIGGPDLDRLQQDKTMDSYVGQAYAPYIVQMSELPGTPGADETVRKAVYTAIDPKAWNQAALQGTGIMSTNFQSMPGGYCYSDLSSLMPKPSAAAAKQILLNAGYTLDGSGKLAKGGKELTINVVGSTTTGSGAEYLSSALNQAGINTVLNNTDYAVFAQNYANMKFDLLVGLFGAPVPAGGANTANFFSGKLPPAGNNRLGRDDPQLAQLVANAYAYPPGDQACAAWKAINTYVIKNSIALPWIAPTYYWFSRKGTFSYIPVGVVLDPPTVVRLK